MYTLGLLAMIGLSYVCLSYFYACVRQCVWDFHSNWLTLSLIWCGPMRNASFVSHSLVLCWRPPFQALETASLIHISRNEKLPCIYIFKLHTLRQNKKMSSITAKQNFQFVAGLVWSSEPKGCHSVGSKGLEVCFLVFLFGNLRLLTSITIYWPRCYIASYYPDLRRIVFGNERRNFPLRQKALRMCLFYSVPPTSSWETRTFLELRPQFFTNRN